MTPNANTNKYKQLYWAGPCLLQGPRSGAPQDFPCLVNLSPVDPRLLHPGCTTHNFTSTLVSISFSSLSLLKFWVFSYDPSMIMFLPRTARVTDWRKPKPVRTQKWGGRNYIFQDNRWKPLFDKKQQKRTKQGRYVKQPLVKKAPLPPKAAAAYPSQRPKAVASPKRWQKPPTWPPAATRSPFPNRRVELPPATRPPTTIRPIARTFPSYPANPNSIRRIDTGLVKDALLAESLIPDVEIDGLKIYKFRGEDSMPGYIPPPDFLWSQARVTSRDSITPPSVTPAPVPTPRTWRPELPPPFPTRHTTRRPDQQRNPVIIIAQSSVQKN